MLKNAIRVENGTCHSWKPCTLSGFNFLIATIIPMPTLEGASVFSSTQPLKTLPNPPSPSTASDLKFLVAAFISAKVKTLKLGESKICPLVCCGSSILGLDASENWLLPALLLVFENMFLLLLWFPDVPEKQLAHRVNKHQSCMDFDD